MLLKMKSKYTQILILSNFFQLLEDIRQKDPTHYGYSRVVRLFNKFEVTGPNGNHVCLVFEVILINLGLLSV